MEEKSGEKNTRGQTWALQAHGRLASRWADARLSEAGIKVNSCPHLPLVSHPKTWSLASLPVLRDGNQADLKKDKQCNVAAATMESDSNHFYIFHGTPWWSSGGRNEDERIIQASPCWNSLASGWWASDTIRKANKCSRFCVWICKQNGPGCWLYWKICWRDLRLRSSYLFRMSYISKQKMSGCSSEAVLEQADFSVV